MAACHCQPQTTKAQSYSRLFRTLKAIALWAVTGQLPARCHGARSGYVRQVPKEFAHITLQGLHVEGRGVHVEESHRDGH